MREFSCLTWNIAKRIKYSEEQVNFINSFNPDVIALQEVLISSDKKLKDLLREADLVKFAKSKPLAIEIEDDRRDAEFIIGHLKPKQIIEKEDELE